MLGLIKGANLLLRFLPELFSLGALGCWVFKIGSRVIVKVALGIGAPLAAAVVWAVFLSPQASAQLPGTSVLVLQVLAFGSAVLGLVATGHRRLPLMS